MLGFRHIFSSFLIFISLKICFADEDNLQDFCPTAIPTFKNRPTPIFINGYPCKNPANVTASDFKTSKLKQAGDTDNFFHSSTNIVSAAEFPGLNTLGLALGRTDLSLDGYLIPHSHPRAAEMMFVTKGAVTVGFIDTSNQVFQKVLKDGDVFIVPKAMLHFIFNTGFEHATLLSVHNSQHPGLIDVSGSLVGSGPEFATTIKERLTSLPQKKVHHHTSHSKMSERHSEL